MATLFITVWGDATQTLLGEPIQEEAVTISGTSAQSSAILGGVNKAMRRVRLYTDTDCFVTWGTDPTALTNGTAGRALGADNPEVFGVESGQRIAVIERV